MIVCAFVPIWGYAAWLTLRNVKQLVDILRIGGLTTANVPWVLDGLPALVLGIFVISLGLMICFLPSRRYYQTIGILGGAAILSLVVMAAGFTMVSPPAVEANVRSLFGMSQGDLVATAVKYGFDPNGQLDLVNGAGLAGLVLFGVAGFQYSATISGELRGRITRSLSLSIFGSLTFFVLFYLPFVWFVLSRFDYDFVVAWSYLFWNHRSAAPLMLPPINALLLTISVPELAPLWAIVGFVAVVGAWLAIPAAMLYVNRIIFSWGMDRLAPSAFSEVNSRFGQPLKLFAFEGVLAAFFYGLTLLNVNPVAYLWWAVLLFLPAFIFPAVSALMLQTRHPELWRFVPWRRWLRPLAALWLVIIVPFYAYAGFIGAVPSASLRGSFWEFAISTGLIVTGVVVLLGIGIYTAARVYNRRRGIDINLISKSIPPE